MITDVITVTTDGEGLSEALYQAEAAAAFRRLSHKEALHLRLLTEEMIGMLHALAGDYTALFWIEDTEGVYELHLRIETLVNSELRQKLLSVSTSGKNIAAKGIMGKIREVFECALEPASARPYDVMSKGMIMLNENLADMGGGYLWSLNQYMDVFAEEGEEQKKEAWDELEKSIVAKLSDDVQISILDNVVELIIIKSAPKAEDGQ